MPDRLSERDEMTLRTLAIVERTTLAEQRRRALRAYAEQARQDEDIAEVVGLTLDARRERQNGGVNVIEIGARRG